MTAAALWQKAACGFHGKIPARGDFVGTGLPRGFVNDWDRWMQRMLASSRERLRERWLTAWLEGPVWRFALMPRICGPDAVLGLWMPSVDRVGRHYPLTLAAAVPDADPHRLVLAGGGFLAAAEAAGREAVACDLPPDALAARMAAAVAAAPRDPGIDLLLKPSAATLWWTDGAPLVMAGGFAGAALPDAARFAAMLDGCAGAPS